MTCSFPVCIEDGEPRAYWLNNGAFLFDDGPLNVCLELMPTECNKILKAAKKHLDCQKPAPLLEVLDSIRPGLQISRSSISATLLGQEITFVVFKKIFGTKIRSVTRIDFSRFAQLVEACFAAKAKYQERVVQPVMGASCLEDERHTVFNKKGDKDGD